MTFSHCEEGSKVVDYFFRSKAPSKVINSEATVEGMWMDDDVPSFLLENGSISLKVEPRSLRYDGWVRQETNQMHIKNISRINQEKYKCFLVSKYLYSFNRE